MGKSCSKINAGKLWSLTWFSIYFFPFSDAQSLRANLSLNRLNPNLRLVTDNIERALFSKYPNTRYSCGKDAKFFFIPLSNLPTWFSDWLLGLALNKVCTPEGDLSALWGAGTKWGRGELYNGYENWRRMKKNSIVEYIMFIVWCWALKSDQLTQ